MFLIMYILYMWYVYRQMTLDYWVEIGMLSEVEIDNINLAYWTTALVGLNLLILQVNY